MKRIRGREVVRRKSELRTQSNTSRGGFMIDPKTDPGKVDNQDGWHVGLEDEVSNVTFQFKGQT